MTREMKLQSLRETAIPNVSPDTDDPVAALEELTSFIEEVDAILWKILSRKRSIELPSAR
jgi:hypothetical protein